MSRAEKFALFADVARIMAAALIGAAALVIVIATPAQRPDGSILAILSFCLGLLIGASLLIHYLKESNPGVVLSMFG